jgi:hypothetical protein
MHADKTNQPGLVLSAFIGGKNTSQCYRIIENGSGRRIVLVMFETISASL